MALRARLRGPNLSSDFVMPPLLAPILLLAVLPVQQEGGAPEPAPAGAKLLTLADFAPDAEHISFRDQVASWSWAWDGKHLVLGRGEDARWLDPSTLVEVPPQEEPERAPREPEGDSKFDAGELEQGRVELDERSPDGAYVAYVTGNDLRLHDIAGETTRSVTTNGSEERFNGKLDWVYQEELYGRGNFKGFWWSPSSKHVAFLSLDEEPVLPFTLVDHVEKGHFRVRPEVTNYPKVGDPNPIPTVGIVPVDGGEVVWMDLGRYVDKEILVTRISWDPTGERCFVTIQDRIQKWADLLEVNPKSGDARVLIEERSDTWTDRPSAPRWLRDGTFLWMSTRTGYAHLYRYHADGELIGPLTQGPWEVRRIRELDEDAGTLLFSASEGGAVDTHWYRTNLDGTGFRRLTQDRGSHTITFNDDGSYFLDRVSSLEKPTEIRLCRGEDGALLRVLGSATIPAAETYRMSRWELHEVAARDGLLLDVAILKPTPFDPSANYPVWIETYSGPDAPTVRNRWDSSAWSQFLAQQGVIQMRCNVRTASGKGHKIISACYGRFGEQELADMEDVVDWLCANSWADGARVGITGYSYGGFMAATCLLRSKKFRLGIAGGGVYDWRLYDTIYTERYMGTPTTNPRGYEQTSCLNHAAGLEGFLHLHAGLMDDNVHAQNLHHMADALMREGKTNWSMMTYANTRHGIRDPLLAWHARRTEWDLIQQHLTPPGPHGKTGSAAAAADFEAAVEAAVGTGGGD